MKSIKMNKKAEIEKATSKSKTRLHLSIFSLYMMIIALSLSSHAKEYYYIPVAIPFIIATIAGIDAVFGKPVITLYKIYIVSFFGLLAALFFYKYVSTNSKDIYFLCFWGSIFSCIVCASFLFGDSETLQTSADTKNNILIGSPHTYDGNRHLVTFAPNRSGKFVSVQAPVLLTLNRSMLVIDPKGQAAAVTARRRREMGQKVITINPFGLHGLPRHKFNPLAALDPAAESFADDVGLLVDGFIDQTGKDPFWSNSARDLFSWLIMWTVLYEPEKTLGTVRDLLCMSEGNEKEGLIGLANDAHKSTFPALRNKSAAFVKMTDNLRSVIQTAKSETEKFDSDLIKDSLSASDFDFSELKNGKTTVYIILPAKNLGSHSKFLRVLVMSALSAMYERHDGERVVFMLDEFAQLGYLRDLENAAGLASGYGVQIWPFLQDLNQLQALYGDRWETFLSNSGIVQAFAPNDLTTARYFSAISGEKFDGKPKMTIDDLFSLPEDKQLISRNNAAGLLTISKTVDYYKNPDFTGMFDSDPYHNG